jgi:putative transcriptional regulator
VLFRRGERAFFAYGFAKNDGDNIRRDELQAFRRLAGELLGLDDTALAAAVKHGTIVEVDCDGEAVQERRAGGGARNGAGAGRRRRHGQATMKAFDAMCLTPVADLSPGQIKAIRVREKASQAVFARYLNVTTGLISQWGRGEKRPRGASLKLLTLVKEKGLQAVA